jgi:hypothetical protein
LFVSFAKMRWVVRRPVLAVVLMFFAYFPAALWLKTIYREPKGPPGAVHRMVRQFQKFGGHAFIGLAASVAHLGDTPDSHERSPAVIYEDGKPLGPAHVRHVDIAEYGGGRFSHWRNAKGFIFSSSDNSDPNLNGREYWIVIPPK